MHSKAGQVTIAVRRRRRGIMATALSLPIPAALLALAGCVSLPTDYPRTVTHTLSDTGATRLGQGIAPLTARHRGESGIHPLRRGIDAFVARLVLTEAADRSLDVQYYIWHADITGKLLANGLLRAADRGVRVRVLLDDLGTAPNDHNLLALDLHPNIEVRLFNPVAARGARGLGTLLEFGRVNRRMHNKSFTADNQAALIGGRNIGDEYFEARPDRDFGDLDALAVGPVVQQVSASFDRFWNSPASVPITALTTDRATDAELEQARAALRAHRAEQEGSAYAAALRDSRLAHELQRGELSLWWGKATVVDDDPSKAGTDPVAHEAHLLPKLAPVVAATTTELMLVSPYFVPGKHGVQWFRALRERGVKMTVLTNSLAANDVVAVHAGYRRYREALLKAGVELWEVKPTAQVAAQPDAEDRRAAGAGLTGSSRASLHAKTFAFDRRVLFIGSLNLDPRSAVINTEIGVLFENPQLASDLVTGLERRLPEVAYRVQFKPGTTDLEWLSREDGAEVRYESEPQASLGRRFSSWFLSWLPIESQL